MLWKKHKNDILVPYSLKMNASLAFATDKLCLFYIAHIRSILTYCSPAVIISFIH